jgi:hypothetical protein
MARSTPSAAAPTPSTAEAGAIRRGPSGLTPAQQTAALLSQDGLTAAEIAAEMGAPGKPLSQRSVRRHLAAARAAGVRTRPATADPAPPSPPQSKRDARFTTPKPKPARARVLLQHDAEGMSQYRPRDHGDGAALGKELAIGDLDEHGRILTSRTTATLPQQSALDYYREPPPGSMRAIVTYEDGTEIEVDL